MLSPNHHDVLPKVSIMDGISISNGTIAKSGLKGKTHYDVTCANSSFSTLKLATASFMEG